MKFFTLYFLFLIACPNYTKKNRMKNNEKMIKKKIILHTCKMMKYYTRCNSNIQTSCFIRILWYIYKLITYCLMLFKETTSLFIYFLEINNNITSFPKKNTVFPLNGYFIIDYDASVISTPHTDILLAIKYSFAYFNDSNI